MSREQVLERAREVADAVLYEGYLLYPYRASSSKNRLRWQFGVLMPPTMAAAGSGEHADSCTECLLEPGQDALLHVMLRFLQVRRRTVEAADDGGYRPVNSLRVGERDVAAWDETAERQVEARLPVADLLSGACTVPFAIDGTADQETVEGGRVIRRCWPLRGELVASAHRLDGPYGGVRLRVEVRNTSDWSVESPDRESALRRALIGAHTLLVIDSGSFMSLLDPPEWAAPAARACVNERSWPVLVGQPGTAEAMLSAPIILYDYPTVAPESPTPLYDGTEIDEILTLRTMALTDDEKRQARATDDRAAELLDSVDGLPPELLDRLHGTVRYLRDVTASAPAPEAPWWDPAADDSVDPDTDRVAVPGGEIGKGSRVLLRPNLHASDAQDMFLVGRAATVQAVLSDVDGACHIAVTIDDDPAAELQTSQGRFRYFGPDEVEPIGGAS